MEILGFLDREGLGAKVDPRPTHVSPIPDDHLEIRGRCRHIPGEASEPVDLTHPSRCHDQGDAGLWVVDLDIHRHVAFGPEVDGQLLAFEFVDSRFWKSVEVQAK